MLTQKERAFFADNGYIGPFKTYEPDEAKKLWKSVRVSLLDTERASYPGTTINYDRHLDVDELSQHISHPRIVQKLQSLIGPDVLCWRSEFFPKYPGDSGTEWHQVESYAYASGTAALVPTQRRENTPMELTVWTAFTESTKENGCMKFMPGSHKVWYFDEEKQLSPAAEVTDGQRTDFFGYHFSELKLDPDWEPDESLAVHLEMQPGESVIFTARCMHGSLPNTSRRKTRMGFTTRYVPTHIRVYPDPNDLTRQQDSFSEHGQFFDLSSHGCVLVAGVDEFEHNRIKLQNARGYKFATLPRQP